MVCSIDNSTYSMSQPSPEDTKNQKQAKRNAEQAYRDKINNEARQRAFKFAEESRRLGAEEKRFQQELKLKQEATSIALAPDHLHCIRHALIDGIYGNTNQSDRHQHND